MGTRREVPLSGTLEAGMKQIVIQGWRIKVGSCRDGDMRVSAGGDGIKLF